MSEMKPDYIIVNRLVDGRVRFAIAGETQIFTSGQDAVQIARALVMVATDQSIHSEFWINVPGPLDDTIADAERQALADDPEPGQEALFMQGGDTDSIASPF